MKKKLTAVLIALICILCFAVHGFADFGDFGGDSDFGDFDFGGGYDSYDYDDDDDYNYNSGGSYSSDSGSSSKYYKYNGYGDKEKIYNGDFIIFNSDGKQTEPDMLEKSLVDGDISDDDVNTVGIIAVVFIAIAIFVGIKGKRKVKPQKPLNTPAYRPDGAQPTDVNTLRSMSEYFTIDPQFSETEFNEKLANLYVQFQNAWQAKNLDSLRPYLSDAYFATVDRQLDNYRRASQTNRIERIAVLGVSLSGWKQERGQDIMVARLRTRIVDYVTDDRTGQIVRGSNTAEKFMEYEWTLSRNSGMKTGAEQGMTVHNCPNCGAVLNINKTAKCEYCGSIVTVDSNDWVVTGIKGIAQKTMGR